MKTNLKSSARYIIAGPRSGVVLWVAMTGMTFAACGSGSETGGNASGTGGSATAGTGSFAGRGGAPDSGGSNAGVAGQSGGTGGVTGTAGQIGSGGSTGGNGGSGGGGAGSGGNAPTGGPVKFLPNVKVNDDTGSANQMETFVAAGPNGTVLVSWVDYRSGLNCGFAASSDGGMTFKKNVLIKPADGNITGDSTAGIDAAGTLYAVCQDYGISQVRVMTSMDKGDTWSAVKSVQSSPDKPWIGASPAKAGTAFVSWLGGDAGVRRTTDNGETWGPVHELEFLNHGTTLSVGSSGVVHVNFTPNGGNIRYARSKDLGDTWEATKTIGQTGTFCWSDCGSRQNPILGGGCDPTGKYVTVVWAATYTGGEGDEDIWAIYSSDSGDTWSKPIKVNDNPNKSRQWQTWGSVDRLGRVHVVWSDMRNGKLDTYYARSLPDPTKGFEPNIQVNDKSGNVPSDTLDYKGLAISGDDVYVSFPDTRNGNVDIYFAKAPGAAGP
jgi:hypothetical protein